ncbi:MAG: ABC transporter ATP-binding protein [Rhodothermia bacterium]
MARLSLRNVTKRYASVTAVDDLSIEVTAGRIFGLLGPNGAGKTSTIRMIAYITAPDSGVIELDGEVVGPHTQECMGYLPEERGLYRRMKVGEQLVYFCMLKGMTRPDARNAVKYWLDRFDAATWMSKRTDQLSKGMQQKVQFVATVAHDPNLLIFDEPFSGLDPINSDLLRDVIFELREKGKTILFASHRMEQVEQICDDICLIADGAALASGSLRKIKLAAGCNVVEIEFDGDASFIDELESDQALEVLNTATGMVRLRLNDPAQTSEILDRARRDAVIFRFELVQPSLNEIFIDLVSAHAGRREPDPDTT